MAARAVFDVYHSCMQTRFGASWPRRTYEANKYWKTSFTKLGKLCAWEQWDPELFVKNALDYLHKNHAYITPHDLTSDKVISWYRSEMLLGRTRYDPLGEWQYLNASVLTYIQDTKSTESLILLSPMLPFPAWFRLLYPEHLNEEIFEVWGDVARQQFAEDRQLRVFARKVAPKVFAQLETRWGRFGDVEVIDHDVASIHT